jgi:glucose/arabinose dehydrogenase
MQPVVANLNFPTSVALDASGVIYIAESGLTFDSAPAGGRVLRIAPDGQSECILDGLRTPVNGVGLHAGWLYISEGGNPGRITRYHIDSGDWRVVLDGLPGFGNYHTNMAVMGPDGKLYFSQGAMTNSGVIGVDSQELAWLREVAHNCDIPGFDVALADSASDAFAPFGAVNQPGRRIPRRVPCTASVMRCDPDGSHLELFAWGLRNAYGLGFLPDGRLLATDQGADDRGSRPIANCPDFLYEVLPGAWYGWPDFMGGRPVTDPRFRPADSPAPQFLLANHAELPPPQAPLLEFEGNTCAVKFALSPPRYAGFAGHLIVALFGDEIPMTTRSGPRVGRKLVRVDPAGWSVHPVQPMAFHRPIDVAFDPSGSAAYVLDFGQFEMTPEMGVEARAASGCLWRLCPDFMEV